MKSDSPSDILPLKNNEILSEEKYKLSFTSLKEKKQRNGCSLVRRNKTVNLYA